MIVSAWVEIVDYGSYGLVVAISSNTMTARGAVSLLFGSTRGPVRAAARSCLDTLFARLVIIVFAISAGAATLVGGVIVYQARSAAQLEIAASLSVAELLVTDTISVMRDSPSDLLLQTMDLQFRTVRHVRIAVKDAAGRTVRADSAVSPEKITEPTPPDWFTQLVALPRPVKVVPVLLRNRLIGSVTITAEPSDEIGEAWHYADALLQAGGLLGIASLGALLVLFAKALAPLRSLERGLQDLEDLTYTTRLPRVGPRELTTIIDHFNQTAAALEAAHAANRALNRQVLTAQDDERRRTALELHDEVGPCLFALGASASSAAKDAAILEGGKSIRERTAEILEIVTRLKGQNRRLLERMRPMGLGRLPLVECLRRIFADLTTEESPTIDHALVGLRESYGPLIDLTIYRCVQEGTLNAVRHAEAMNVRVKVGEMSDQRGRVIAIHVADDGHGIIATSRSGLGLSGMRERISALGGSFTLVTSGAGTRLDIWLPIDVDGGDDTA